MTFFSEYIKSIITIAIGAFICESICSYFSKSKTSYKGLKFITNLCVFTVTVTPLFSLFGNFSAESLNLRPQSIEPNSEYDLLSLTEKEVEKQLTEQILKGTDIEICSIDAELSSNENSTQISSISIVLKDEAEIEKVSEFINSNYSGEFTTEITVKRYE